MFRSRVRVAVVEVLQPDLPGILGVMSDPQLVLIVVVIGASSALAGDAAVTRLAHPRPVAHLTAVAVAALIGFAGSEMVARYRIRVGRKIGSAALVADGLHARPGADHHAVLASHR